MLHNDQQDRMQNSASGLTVSTHKGGLVGYLREAIGVKMRGRIAERDVYTPDEGPPLLSQAMYGDVNGVIQRRVSHLVYK